MSSLASPNFDDRPSTTAIDMLVLHYTGMVTAEAALKRLCDPASKVSAHYVIDEDGSVFELVDEDKRAWHAGIAHWRGAADVNGRSIGIELVNPGHEFGYRGFPEAQMTALEGLAIGVLDRHSIEPRNVVGHSDVAPGRKSDPGELFDWRRMAARGIGLWPDAGGNGTDAPARRRPADSLRRYGYAVDDVVAAITAFQRHFRPERIDGRFDGETATRLDALLAAI